MGHKVFYAWQSDRNQKVCHYFIRDALKTAMKQIVREAQDDDVQEAKRPELDHDRKDVPGTPRIAETIERKIRKAAVFVADLTAITDFKTFDGREKQTPNANVLIELGMAFRSVKSERILLVMNTAFGGPEHLPFDLKDRSHPIQYDLKDQADPDFKAKQKKLAEKLVDPLKACLKHYEAVAQVAADGKRQSVESGKRAKAGELWEAFKKRLHDKDFYDVEADRFFAAAVLPLDLTADKIDMNVVENDEDINHYLPPLGSSSNGWNIDPYGKSYVTHNGRNARHERPAERPTTVTELTDQGCIFAVDGNFIGSHQRLGDVLALQTDEQRLFQVLTKYVRGLRRIGVTGRLEVRLLLTGMSGVKLLSNISNIFDHADLRPIKTDAIDMDPATLDATIDGTSISAVAEAIRPQIEMIWKDGGAWRDPCFDTEGKYRPKH